METADGSDEYRQLAEILPDDFSDPADSLEEIRAKFDLVHGHSIGADVEEEITTTGIWVRPEHAPRVDAVVFFVHGGGFVTSPAATYTFYAANIARACRTEVFVAEYRLAPETVHPGQTDDLLAAYRQVVERHDPARIVFMGDSCGGGMALATIIAARDRGLPTPAGFVGLCGWFDLEATGESATDPTGRDPFLDAEWLRLRGRDYVGPDGDPAAPEVSPLHADPRRLPPMLLHAGAFDRCRSDAERLAARVDGVGGHAELVVWPGMPHGFHGLVGAVPEADRAMAAVADFIVAQTPD